MSQWLFRELLRRRFIYVFMYETSILETSIYRFICRNSIYGFSKNLPRNQLRTCIKTSCNLIQPFFTVTLWFGIRASSVTQYTWRCPNESLPTSSLVLFAWIFLFFRHRYRQLHYTLRNNCLSSQQFFCKLCR